MLYIVEDDPDFAALLKEISKEAFSDVEIFLNSPDFIKKQLTCNDVIILDIKMPKMDGVEILRALAEKNCLSKLILISGFDSSVLHSTAMLAQQLGLQVIAQITKPVDPDKVQAILASLIKQPSTNITNIANPSTKSTVVKSTHFSKEEISKAIKDNQLVLYYQPQVDLKTNKLIGVEALVRWLHPEKSMIFPDDFLPFVEKYNLLEPLTDSIIKIAIEQESEWEKLGYNVNVSINVCASNVTSLSLPEKLEELIKKDIKVIITTHHKRLAALMASNKNVELIAAIYDEKNQKPTYNFLQGTIGRSYAFETAERYGIPKNVIAHAKEVYGDDQDKLNELIERSSELEREYLIKIDILNSEIETHKNLNSNLKEQKESLDDHIYVEKSKLHKEYRDATTDAKEAIKAKISQESHRLLNKAHKKVKEIKTEKVQEPIELKVGDRVKYKSSRGEIVSIKGKRAFILNDTGMKLQVNLTDLKRSGNEPKVKVKKTVTVTVQKPDSGHVKLDLHGQRADEAIDNLDKFISDALIAGFDEILVYHGIGTGKLSYAVKKFLDSHPKVKGYEDAHPAQGGFGAKVIKL